MGGEKRQYRRGSLAAKFALGAAGLGLAVVPVAAAASAAPHKKPTPLQQGLNFYKGKTITLIAPDSPGGGFDTNARIIAPFMATYLGATINVTNDPPANTVAGQDLMEASKPDGLTLGMINPGADIENIVTGLPGLNFNPQKVQFLGGTATGAGSAFECNTPNPSGIKTFADAVHATAASPVTEVIVSSGAQTLSLDLIDTAFDLKSKVIGGYVSTSAEVAGQERGDGECGVLGIATPGFGPYDAAGKAAVMMINGHPNPATAFASEDNAAMQFSAAEKAFPATTKLERDARAAISSMGTYGVGHQYNAPAKTAGYKVLALRAAVQKALTNVQCEDKLLASGQPVGWVTGPRALRDYKLELKSLTPLKALIATALGV